MKKYLTFSLFFILYFSISSISFAQTIVRQLATEDVHQRLLAENPNMRQNIRSIERKVSQFMATSQPINIPIIFHIIYANGDSIPSPTQISNQLDVLNQDFNQSTYQLKAATDSDLTAYSEIAADTEIQFCLADEQIIPISNINYVLSPVSEWTTDDALKSSTSSGSNAYDATHFLNIWVANLSDNISGYAQMPGGPANTDGVVIDP